MSFHAFRWVRTPVLLCPAILLLATAVAADDLVLTASKNPIPLGEELTISFTPPVLSTGDSVIFTFGDGKEESVEYTPYCGLFGGCGTITHTYTRIGTFVVHGIGSIGGNGVSGTLEVLVTAGDDLFVLAAAHSRGANETVWRSDVELHNYGAGTAMVEIALLKRDTDNSTPQKVTVQVAAGAVLRLEDILESKFGFTGAAALRIATTVGVVIASSRTYNLTQDGTYGQYVPALKLQGAIRYGDSARLIQLSHDPTLAAGFRTNLGLLNPAPYEEDVEISFYDPAGVKLATSVVSLQPLEFKQLDRVWGLATASLVEDGYIRVRTTTPDGLFFTYASLVDNLTGDPTLIPAQVP